MKWKYKLRKLKIHKNPLKYLRKILEKLNKGEKNEIKVD